MKPDLQDHGTLKEIHGADVFTIRGGGYGFRRLIAWFFGGNDSDVEWMMNRQIDWLIETHGWSFDCLIDWLIELMFDWSIDWLYWFALIILLIFSFPIAGNSPDDLFEYAEKARMVYFAINELRRFGRWSGAIPEDWRYPIQRWSKH